MSAPRTEPPRRKPAHRWAGLKRDVRSLLGPLLVYWLLLFGAFGAFAAIALTDAPSGDGLMIIGFFGLVTFGGVGLGQALALLRVRDWVLMWLWAVTWIVGFTFGLVGTAALGAAAGPFMILLVLTVFLGPLFALAGAWSLRTGRDLFGTWVPLMYATGSTIILAERSGRVSEWHAGSKWAIWDGLSIGILAVTVTLLVAFVIMRERRRLHLWRSGKRALLPSASDDKPQARPGIGILGWIGVGGLAMALTVGSALLGPYLWRTGRPGDHDGDGHGGTGGTEQVEQGEGEGEGQQGQGEPKPVDDAGEEVSENLQPMSQRQLEQQSRGEVDPWTTLLILSLLLLLALFVFWRPVRRLILIRHLRRPLWAVSSTTRVEHLWRMVEIALGDAGVEPKPGESAVQLAQRARPRLLELSRGHVAVHGLGEAAAVRDRVAYGLGVAAGDPERMAEVADDAYETVWNRLDDRAQLKAIYRGLW